ncbi:conserved hypothetical protein [Gloeothece citriformis PCC 7424]|uniref:Uncharacterized protein n=1 Tax=Gloeothece citriformis (strain PCC 7424) TaxID=65393 RepID=B7KG71_GLOC7|nr:NifX-associated nitrogen fixation protein [Gloeothece citriformis]ACK70542.1 conserved hypothetical protein [Gloeothece citriformis PCC 7424]
MSQVATLSRKQNSIGLEHPFLDELLKQFRLHDSSGDYQTWSNELLLNSLIVSSGRTRKNPNSNAVDSSLYYLRISAFYHTVAKEIEKKTGRLPQIFINLSPKGSSSALIFCGNLLVVYDLLEKVSSFGFESLDKLVHTGEQLIHHAVARVHQFF